MPKNKFDFQPVNKQQKLFFESMKRFELYSGAVGAGKSVAGCIKGIALNVRFPGNRGLICRKENTALKGSTLVTLLKLLPENMIVKHDRQRGEIIHRTVNPRVNSTIVYSGLDKKADGQYPTKIGSTEFGWIFADEITELELGDFEMLGARLRWKPAGYSKELLAKMPRLLFGATNPDGPFHWCYLKFFENEPKRMKNGELVAPLPEEQREVFIATPYDNTELPKDYIKSLEDSLTGARRERLLYGKWIQPEGVIYKDFDPNKHVTEEGFLKPKDYKSIIFGGDSNYPLPRAGLIIGTTGNGEYHVLHEHYVPESHAEDMAEWLEKHAKIMQRGLSGFHDPSDPDAIAIINRKSRVRCEKANNSVEPGISTVSEAFKKGKIKIHSRCKHLIQELLSYVWKKGVEGVPLKENDHLVDSLRYALQSHNPKKKGRLPTALKG